MLGNPLILFTTHEENASFVQEGTSKYMYSNNLKKIQLAVACAILFSVKGLYDAAILFDVVRKTKQEVCIDSRRRGKVQQPLIDYCVLVSSLP